MGNWNLFVVTGRQITNTSVVSTSADELFEKFVLAGADIHQPTLYGTYPLLLAVSIGAKNIVKAILDKGVDVNIVDHCEETSLTKAISSGSDDMMKLLIVYGANVNQSCKGPTTFQTETSRGNIT